MTEEKIKIVLADDHPIVLEGLRNLLAAESDFEIVGQATGGLAALSAIRDTRPAVALVDLSMPELGGIALCRTIAEEKLPTLVVVLTLHEDRAFVKQALAAGARGYIVKRSASDNLVPAIRAVLDGGLYLDPAIADQAVDSPRDRVARPPGSAGIRELTEREADVLRLTAQGFTNKEIAHRIGVSTKSVETYKLRGMEKLGLRTRAEIVRYALGQAWFTPL